MSDTEPGSAAPMTTGDGDDGGANDIEPDGPDTSGQPPADDSVIQAEQGGVARMAEQVKTAAREVGSKARAAADQEPKRSWGAMIVAVAAGAGIIAGAVRRRRNLKRRRKWFWKRR